MESHLPRTAVGSGFMRKRNTCNRVPLNQENEKVDGGRHQRLHGNTVTCYISGITCSCGDFMACSICLQFMPHSAISSVSDDTLLVF